MSLFKIKFNLFLAQDSLYSWDIISLKDKSYN